MYIKLVFSAVRHQMEAILMARQHTTHTKYDVREELNKRNPRLVDAHPECHSCRWTLRTGSGKRVSHIISINASLDIQKCTWYIFIHTAIAINMKSEKCLLTCVCPFPTLSNAIILLQSAVGR
jgi:hypothetical protein